MLRVAIRLRSLVLLIGAALALGSESWLTPTPPPPLAGFSFSPISSMQAGRDPASDLERLLGATQPDLVRLPIYWELVQPSPDELDFSSVDSLLAVIATHDATSESPTRVVLTVGARNFTYPELHMPAWAGARSQPNLDGAQSGVAYRAYFDASITRYRASPLLFAWQVENEPLDYVAAAMTGDDRISASQLSWEMAEVHELDPRHEAVTTTYNGLNTAVDMLELWAPPLVTHMGTVGHPNATLQVGDALGLDLYIDGPSVPLRHVTSLELRSEWKEQTVAFWAARARDAGKELWLTEMQAQPWDSSGTFAPKDLVASARDYRQEPLEVVLLWGVQTWLGDPAWMAAATQSIAILRAS
jgi:hypothetical protein